MSVISKKDLVESVASKLGVSKADATSSVDALLGSITDALAQGRPVRITGFGAFEVKERPARTGRNPQTGEPVQIEAKSGVKFKASKTLI